MDERSEKTLAFGPVGLGGIVLLLLGILSRRRMLALLGLAGVVADMKVAGLGGFKAMNEPRRAAADVSDEQPTL